MSVKSTVSRSCDRFCVVEEHLILQVSVENLSERCQWRI